MKLEWEEVSERWWSANTPVGSYTVNFSKHYEPPSWIWEFWFNGAEIYECIHSCSGLEEGKRQAEAHWEELIAPIIAPYIDTLEDARRALSDEVQAAQEELPDIAPAVSEDEKEQWEELLSALGDRYESNVLEGYKARVKEFSERNAKGNFRQNQQIAEVFQMFSSPRRTKE